MRLLILVWFNFIRSRLRRVGGGGRVNHSCQYKCIVLLKGENGRYRAKVTTGWKLLHIGYVFRFLQC